jgi:hypothetical protein
MSSNPSHRDWLEADDSYLPTNQLPLLRNVLGRRLLNIQRFISDPPDTWIGKGRILTDRQDFFRKAHGPIMFELEGLPPICFRDSYSYALDFDEYSIAVNLDSRWQETIGKSTRDQRYTLHDREYVDDRLYHLIGQRINKMQILIRTIEYHKDTPRALQDGIEMSFDNDITIILSYMLDESGVDALKILYTEEVRWQAVLYKIDIVKGKLPLSYRFRRWWWRALDRAGRRLEHH